MSLLDAVYLAAACLFAAGWAWTAAALREQRRNLATLDRLYKRATAERQPPPMLPVRGLRHDCGCLDIPCQTIPCPADKLLIETESLWGAE